MSCNLCQSQDFKIIFVACDHATGNKFKLVKCTSCGLVSTYPKPKDAKLDGYYLAKHRQKKGKLFGNFFEILVSFFRQRRVKMLLTHKQSGRVLDVGCGRGLELKMLAAKGFEVYGIERPWRKWSDPKGKIKIKIKKLIDCHFPEQFFNLITFWHSLEHLDNPNAALGEVKKILKNNGFLVIELPNFSSLQARLFGKFWFHLDVPRHLYHFTMTTLEKMLKNNGFKIISWKKFSFEYDLFGFSQSLLNLLFPNKQNYLLELMTMKKKTLSIKEILPLIIYLLLTIPVVFVSCFLVIIDSLFFGGGTIRVVARKNKI